MKTVRTRVGRVLGFLLFLGGAGSLCFSMEWATEIGNATPIVASVIIGLVGAFMAMGKQKQNV